MAERPRLDNHTEQYGLEGPFKPWEWDHTALVHVLWSVKYAGLTIEDDADEIASRIMHSRWLAAQQAAARGGVIAPPEQQMLTN